jgi:predicted TIM-barrel fold metal-dependent hydrolase
MQGVRVHVTGSGSIPILAGDALDPLYRRLSDAGLPILLLSRNVQAHDHYGRIADRFPDLKMVIEHMGFATTPPFGGTPESADNFMRLASRPGIVVKLAVHHQHTQGPYPWADLHPLQHRFIAEFGAERLMWGSNWPMKPEEVTFPQRIEVMSKHFPFANDHDRDWIMGRTAERLWPALIPASS